MLELRTSKAIKTSLHDDELAKVVFKYRYSRTVIGMKFMVDAYSVVDEQLELVRGGSNYIEMPFDQVNELIAGAESIAVPNENPIINFDNLVLAGIKVYIISQGLWKNQLTLGDFEDE